MSESFKTDHLELDVAFSDKYKGGEFMETYRLYPPQMTAKYVPYQVLADGVADCQHELETDAWGDRISVQDGIVFVTFSCRHCGRKLSQSFDEIVPPGTWKNGRMH
jgi:hypothetical protein